MSKEKQIEEMANDLAQHCPDLVENCCGASSCVSCLTRFLYNAGYRKQSEGENISGYPSLFECSVCHWRDDDTYTGDTSEYNYCPNCGAKMKGGAE